MYLPLDHTVVNHISINKNIFLYLHDLYLLHSKKMEFDLHAKIPCPDQIADLCVAQLDKQIDLSSIDFWILPNAGFMLSQRYVSAPLHWKNKFNIRAEIIEVKECGILCVFESLLLAQSLHLENKNYKIVIMTIENSYSPLNKAFSQSHYFAYMILNKDSNNLQSYKILICQKISHKIKINYFEKLIKKYGISKNKIACYSRNRKKFMKYFENFTFHEVFFSNSSGFVYYCLSILLNHVEYILLLDSDHDSIGYTLLQRNFQ